MTFFLWLIKRVIHEHSAPVTLRQVRRILVLDPNYIGDMLLSSPVYKALKQNLPDAEVDALVYPFTKEILHANPFIDHIHYLPKGNLFQQRPILTSLRKKRFDLVLQLNTSLRTNFLLWLIGGRYRLGYDYRNRGCFNNIRIPIPTRTAQTQYRVDECLELLEKALGWDAAPREMILQVPGEQKLKASQLLDEHGITAKDVLVGIQANCRDTWMERKWEQSKFSDLANELIEKYAVKVVFTGSQDDLTYVTPIISGIKRKRNVVNLVGKTTLMELAALLQRIDIFVTVNTGPMQIAVSQRTPTIALMGVTPPRVTYPMNVPIFQYIWLNDISTSPQPSVDPRDSTRMSLIEVRHVMEKVDFLMRMLKKI